ncbi:MAG: GxxExxY protein [Opitutaceae bacterium]|nr:GxxExxY protein [Opitutaceae bacterium]
MHSAHANLSKLVIGAAMDVLNTLKPGLDEKLYERALVIELKNRGLAIDQQKSFEVHYKEELIGTLDPDLIVKDNLVVDAKVVSAFNESHLAQMLGYLNITGIETGLLLNFKFSKLGIKRVTAFQEEEVGLTTDVTDSPDDDY